MLRWRVPVLTNKGTIAAAAGAIARALETYDPDEGDRQGVLALAAEASDHPGARVAFQVIDAMAAAAALASGDPAFGLTLAQQYAAFCHHLHFALAASQTLLAAVEQLIHFQAIISDQVHVVLDRRDADYSLRFACPEPPAARWTPTDTLAGSFIYGARAMTLRPGLNPVSLAVRRPAAGVEHRYRQLFRCPIAFDQPSNVFHLSRETLHQPLPTANSHVLGKLEELLLEYQESLVGAPLTTRLRRIVTLELRNGPPKRDAIARRLGLSQRSLSRQLAEEGTSFTEVLHSVRAVLARETLARGGSVTETAFLLGFSDTSAFSRAFRRWTDEAPSDFVKRRRA